MAVFSCEPGGEFATPTRGAEYYPLEVGSYTDYDVDSVAIRQNVETRYQFELRLEVKGEFENATGNRSFVIQRLKRTNSSDPWKPSGTWSAWTDARNAVSVEGNERFVRLQFPIAVGNEWNGNAMNSHGGDDDCSGTACDRYEVAEVDPDVVVIQSNVPDKLVKYDVRTETYSKEIGLIHKEMTVLEYCSTPDCFGKQFVDNGLKYTQTLKEHGKI